MIKKLKTNLLLFVLAQVLTFAFITLLQMVDFPIFLLFLLLMHIGVVLFIVSKKLFEKSGIDVKNFYNVEYLMLAFYIPVLLYKLLSHIFPYTVNTELKMTYTFAITAAAVIVSIINTLRLYNSLKKESIE